MKRNAKGGGSVRQRENGKWEARCTVNGKRLSFYGDKQSEVLKAMRAALAASDTGTYFEPKKITLEKWVEVWLDEYVQPSVKPLTYSAYKASAKTHIIPALGHINLAHLNPTQVQAFYNDLLRVKKISPKTIRNIHGVLHKALDQAVELRYIGINPTNACKLPRVERKEIKPLTEAEIAAFMDTAKDDEFADIFTVTLFLGLRRGEVCGLSWDAVSFKTNTITIKQQLCIARDGTGYYIAPTKSDKIRAITAPQFIMDLLREVKREQAIERVECAFTWKNEHNLVFTNHEGQHIAPVTLYSHFKRIAEKIGRADARFHDLRHTYAVTALQEGDDVKTVQQNLGHATASFTLDVYGHVSEKMKQESANRMQKYFESLKA